MFSDGISIHTSGQKELPYSEREILVIYVVGTATVHVGTGTVNSVRSNTPVKVPIRIEKNRAERERKKSLSAKDAKKSNYPANEIKEKCEYK